ncbi:MAG: hypothetical protein WCA45_07370 [Thiobacillaceae bacterium]
MDWLTFISKVVDAVAWPIAAVTLFFFLRPEIKTLFSLIKRLKAGPVEAEFEREVKELRTEAEMQMPALPVPPPQIPERQKLLQLAQLNPRSAILEAWQGVEFTAQRVVSDRALFVPPREATSPMAVIRALNKAQLLSSEEVALYHDLRALRNQAAHVQDFSPTYDSALNYIELAGRLQGAFTRGAGNAG